MDEPPSSGEINVRARQLRRALTPEERLLWDQLRDRRLLNAKFRRQHPLGLFILDFYAPEVKLAIEVDGHFHTFEDVAARDEWRTAEIEQFGIRVIRFTNDEVRHSMNWVLGDIAAAIVARRTTSPPDPLSIP